MCMFDVFFILLFPLRYHVDCFMLNLFIFWTSSSDCHSSVFIKVALLLTVGFHSNGMAISKDGIHTNLGPRLDPR